MPSGWSLGYWLYQKQRFVLAYACLYGDCGLSVLVLGHYVITPPSTLSLTINGVIWAEAPAALVLAIYTRRLQRGDRPMNLESDSR